MIALSLQAAIAAHLLADADLVALVGGRIHDAPPRNAAFPLVVLGETAQADWSSGTEAGGEVRLVLHVWSRAEGKREAWTIIGALMRLLHDAPLTLDDASLVLIRTTYAEVRQEPDGITQHGVLRIVALVEG